MTKNNPIGVFDSGIGGLSVLRQLIRFMPNESFIYLGDTARVPYGNKSEETVKTYSNQCTNFLIDKNVKLIIIACNTVSAVAIEEVQRVAGDVPVIGMIVPAAAAALRSTVNGRIGIIGTRATINSGAYTDEILKLSANVEVISQACPLFVPFVEEGLTEHNSARLVAEEYLEKLKKENVDTLVLGCTHYPLLSRLITEIMPGVTLIDSGEHASVTALRLLAERNLLQDEKNEFMRKPEIEFFVTDVPSVFFEQAQRFLGFGIESPGIVRFGEC